MIHWWCALNRNHHQILNQDCSFKQFVFSISDNLLQHDFVHDNWNKRFYQHFFAYNNWWYDKKKQRVEAYKSIEKKIKWIILMYENKLFCQFSEFFLFYEFFASFYDDCLHKWNMLLFFSASLKISENYYIQFVIEKRLCQAERSSFSINFETSSNIRNKKCIVEIWHKNLWRNSNLDESLNTIDDIYSFNRNSRMFSLNFWLHLVRFRKNRSRNY